MRALYIVLVLVPFKVRCLDNTEDHFRSGFPGTNGTVPETRMLIPGIPFHPRRDDLPNAADHRYPVLHAGVPQKLSVDTLPLTGGDHQLVFNVSWIPSLGPPARDYSVEVISETNTEDCRSPICYEYDIPGNSTWRLVPTLTNTIAETCTIRPGCGYRVKLIAHPWDGHTALNLNVILKECESGVCSCGHAPHLPAPVVQATTETTEGERYTKVTWSLPQPLHPLRLPKGLRKGYYFVSIGKQMVSDAHPSPWFAHTISRQIDAEGLVADGEPTRWVFVPITERSDERRDERGGRTKMLGVKLLARVYLVDERGCIGPAGNSTAYDPAAPKSTPIGSYALWATLGGACVLVMVAVFAVSARAAKRVLRALRPAPVSAPLEPLRLRPAWFPMQLRT